ncbi:Threonine/homoserine/homoserine lactone efflux protein [Quadrisphaera granulorum]|uniref:Threonine/homoserine/homoserine lactone efflux protein n=1 Tax=Quadrisphaera granulorum TaxID=317664 RepID=A0A316A9T7_9ACTN|nr:LysE family translocator [Quadrisphaera granulorum]PWJ53760.1 threonine/homoserine/homoserine lactone efflux protein [Quadrisphaera granulorum]SZE96517.1 Threonine/homoserine/homoserine lactone efflux protein [Quadrisphaera granulorum]
MLTSSTVLLFLAAALPLAAFPGPAVAVILAVSLRHGRAHGLAATAGVEAGNAVHVLAATVGLSALVAASATAFTVVKVVGAMWLLWLALTALRSRSSGTLADLKSSADPQASSGPLHHSARRGLLVGVLNPKTAIFFVAFLPQFVDPAGGPAWAQLAALGLLFVAAATVFDCCWALAGAGMSGVLRRVRLVVLDRVSAGIYAALAALTLSARRATT